MGKFAFFPFSINIEYYYSCDSYRKLFQLGNNIHYVNEIYELFEVFIKNKFPYQFSTKVNLNNF